MAVVDQAIMRILSAIKNLACKIHPELSQPSRIVQVTAEHSDTPAMSFQSLTVQLCHSVLNMIRNLHIRDQEDGVLGHVLALTIHV